MKDLPVAVWSASARRSVFTTRIRYLDRLVARCASSLVVEVLKIVRNS